MLTNNFYTYLRCALALRPDSALPFGCIDTQGKTTYAAFYGASYTWSYAGDLSRAYLGRVSVKEGAIWLGAGANAATKSDYTLQSPLSTSSMTCGVSANDGGEDENGHVFSEITIRIIASSSITVSEVGYLFPNEYNAYHDLFTYQDTQTGAGAGILIDRTVLDTPLTLNSGEVGFVKYRITNETEFPE